MQKYAIFIFYHNVHNDWDFILLQCFESTSITNAFQICQILALGKKW